MAYELQIPKINPIRLIPANLLAIDYVNTFPRVDLMTQRQVYQKGEYTSEAFYVNWMRGKQIILQVQAEASTVVTARLYAADGTYVPLAVGNITPVGWTGWDVHKITGIPYVTGFFYIQVIFHLFESENDDAYFYSDTFYVQGDNATEKELVEIKYRNSYNKLGCVFSDYFQNYFVGMIEEGESDTENTVSKEDDGVSLSQSKSYGGIKVTFAEIHRTQLRQIEKIMQCDDLLINGMHVIAEKGIEKEKIEKSDLFNISIEFTYANPDNYMDLF